MMRRETKPSRTFMVTLLLALVCYGNSGTLCQQTTTAVPLSSLLGNWKGESICAGNRPACKNEIVVYRFEAIDGKPDRVMLFADKIIDGKREPMGKLEFQYDKSKGTLAGEFTRRQTHGLWEFQVSGDTIEGTLVLLPNRELGRRVKVKRVSEQDVPEAPDRKDYEGV